MTPKTTLLLLRTLLLPLFYSLLAALICSQPAFSQNNMVTISGRVTDAATGMAMARVQIFNIRTGETKFSDTSGRFIFPVFRNDSLYFSSFGFTYKMICLKDSPVHESYYVRVQMKRIQYELPNVNVYTKREFETIQREAQKLGYDKNDYMLHGYEVLQSPITALWQQFSRQEKDKRGYAELMNTYRKNELVKEILRLYSEQGMITIPEDQIDLFVDYCNISEVMLQRSSAYNIVLYLKTRVEPFEAWLAAQQKKVRE